MEKPENQFYWWYCFTPGGMVSIAMGSLKPFLVALFLISMIGCLATTCFFIFCWKPVIDEAIERLPTQATLVQGSLQWYAISPSILGKNSFLSLSVDTEKNDIAIQNADVQFEFGLNEFGVGSLFGFLHFEYSPSLTMNLARSIVEPWWGAWNPFIMAGLFLLSFGTFVILGSQIGLMFALPLWLVCKFFRKNAIFLQYWKMAILGQFPGAVWLSVALALYGIKHLDITGFLISILIYFILVGIYLLLIPFFIPGASKPSKEISPFASKPTNITPGQ